jgi:hypothetical protein
MAARKHAAVAELMRWLLFCIMNEQKGDTQENRAKAQLRAGA